MNYHNKGFKAGALLLLAILLATLFLWGKRDIPADSSRWQAVFLTDGQVYFGKLRNHNDRFALLDKVYYLKFSQGLQQSYGNNPGSSQLNLIKLGGEAHGPENRMYISKDQILFIENLKENSAVVQAILNNR